MLHWWHCSAKENISFVLLWKQDATRKKANVFAYTWYLENKTKPSSEKNDGTLFNAPKQTSMQNLKLFWQWSILAILFNTLFSTKPFNWEFWTANLMVPAKAIINNYLIHTKFCECFISQKVKQNKLWFFE